jgi:hypothetical protein
MKIGILADIHEGVEDLTRALTVLRREAVDRLVVLGDIIETGERIGPTVALLAEAGTVGVWGNHDLGLCYQPEEPLRSRYAGAVLDYMQTLRPRLEVDGCLFSHALPCWDPTDPVICYLGPRPETAEGRSASFAASACRVHFMGHFHRWLVATPEGGLDWHGGEAILLPPPQRYLVVVAAVCDGWCATFDTDSNRLVPWRLRDDAWQGKGSEH